MISLVKVNKSTEKCGLFTFFTKTCNGKPHVSDQFDLLSSCDFYEPIFQKHVGIAVQVLLIFFDTGNKSSNFLEVAIPSLKTMS